MNSSKGNLKGMFNGNKLGYAIFFMLGGLVSALIFLLFFDFQSLDGIFMKGVVSDKDFDETYFLEESAVNGAINIKHSQDIVILDVKLSADELIDCELTYDKNEFSFFGVKSIESGVEGKFSTGIGSVKLSNLEGNHYLVFLRSLHYNPAKINAVFYNGMTQVSNLTMDIKF